MARSILIKHVRLPDDLRLWLGRALWLCLLFSLLPLASTRKADPLPKEVITNKPRMCVHTRFTDEVDEWKIAYSLELIREMGASTIVEFFPWAYIEGRQGHYDWARADMMMKLARLNGIRVIARLGFVPEWARPQATLAYTTLNTLDRNAYGAFATFVGAFVARYSDTLHGVILWNEPNLAFEWGYQQVSPEDYVALLKAVYPIAKQANPAVLVLGGALAPTLEPEGSPYGLNDLVYLERMLRADAHQFMDALAVHSYGATHPHDHEPAFERLNFRRAELLQALLARYAPNMPAYITEFGWNDHPRWANAVRPSQRVQYTIGALEWANTRWQWANALCVWVFRYPAPTRSYPDNFTLATTDFQLKALYGALRAYATGQESDLTWLPPPQSD